jgi:hypothetical protein
MKGCGHYKFRHGAAATTYYVVFPEPSRNKSR